MARSRTFLAMRSTDADSYLLHLRNTVPAVPDVPIVVLAVLKGASVRNRLHTKLDVRYYQYFKDTCNRIFEENGGQTPDYQANGKADYIACAWFPTASAFPAVLAASAIQHELLGCQFIPRRPSFLAVALNEYGAFRLARSAGHDQTIVDPVIWSRFPQEIQRFAESANIHPPDDESLQAETERVVTHVVNCVPWESLPLEPPPTRIGGKRPTTHPAVK